MVTWQNYKFACKQFVVSLIYWDINMTLFSFLALMLMRNLVL